MTRDTRAENAGVRLLATDTVRDAQTAVAAALSSAGIEGAQADARFLVQGILGLTAGALLRDPDFALGEKAQALDDAVRRRLAHEPVSRILGARDFYGRTFKVTPDVLDPRADTETLVDLVLDTLRAQGRLHDALTIADIGVGSGAILLTLLAELPAAQGVGIDVSPSALAVTQANAERLGVFDRLRLIATRGLNGVQEALDVIVANPPYIPTDEIAGLGAGVRAYDPHLALDGGADGLQIYREIANDVRALERSCWLFLEFGAGQCADVERVFGGFDVRHIERRADLGGHIRAVALEIHR